MSEKKRHSSLYDAPRGKENAGEGPPRKEREARLGRPAPGGPNLLRPKSFTQDVGETKRDLSKGRRDVEKPARRRWKRVGD